MHPRRNGRILVWFAVGMALVLAGRLAIRAVAPQPVAVQVASASSAPDPRSCKPSPPVTVTLTSTPVRGIWRIQLTARAAVAEAELRIGTGAPGAESQVATVWRGALAAGETREVETRYAFPSGDTDVWAEVAADENRAAIQRSRARLHITNGVAVAAAEPADAGRLVTDSKTGATVVEYPGAAAVSR
jgi:hypothetical protein